jgi:hypothetical protein
MFKAQANRNSKVPKHRKKQQPWCCRAAHSTPVPSAHAHASYNRIKVRLRSTRISSCRIALTISCFSRSPQIVKVLGHEPALTGPTWNSTRLSTCSMGVSMRAGPFFISHACIRDSTIPLTSTVSSTENYDGTEVLIVAAASTLQVMLVC